MELGLDEKVLENWGLPGKWWRKVVGEWYGLVVAQCRY